MPSLIRRLPWAAALFALAAQASPPPSTANLVIFNTECALCHEGQCSGRLSFSSRAQSVSEHIRRHAGVLPANGIDELFEVLAYMKQHCAFYPLAATSSGQRAWHGEELAEFALPSRRAYFVPLGAPPGGNYRALLDTSGESAFCVEILVGDFDSLANRCVPGGNNRLDLRFGLEKSQPLYLRLRAEQPLDVIGLELVSQP